MTIFKKRFFVLLFIPMLLSFFVLSGGNDQRADMAAPQFVSAKPGPIEIVQPDGSKLTIQLFGDEGFHYSQTHDGYTTMQDAVGFHYYAEQDENGDLVISDTVARNPEERTMREKNFLTKVGKDLRFSERQMKNRKRMPVEGENIDDAEYWGVNGTFPTTGNRNFLVILVNFTDKSFVKTQSDFNTLMNGSSNSFKDYYLDNSFNQLNLTVDVVGPYNLSGSMSTYGANDSQGYDVNPRLMVQEGVDAAEAAGVDFSDYDNDGNGYVDGIMVVHAGYGEEAGAPAYTIWSHRWSLSSYARTYDGVTINDYTTVPELAGTSGSTLTGIGVICHEFGHNLGAPDTYDTDYSTNGQAWDLGKWDIMAGGSWNNNGNTPANFCAFHRWQLGWQTPTTLDATATNVTLANSAQNNDSYIIYTPTTGEYFMLENRQQIGYDAYLPGHGMLIYHIDENWISSHSSNNLNAYSSHQGIDVEEADNTRTTASYGGDPFPGTSNVTSFTDTTTPSSVTWASANTGKPITNISESSGVISFDITVGGGPGSYCDSASNNANYEWISNVTVGSYSNNSSGAKYTDFTSETINLAPGANTSLSFTPGFSGTTYNEYWKVYIDYNGDNDFADSGEQIFSAGPSKTTVTGNFTVPAGASGTTRMRVIMKYNAAVTGPCEDGYSYGETEDYTVDFSGTVPAPVANFTASSTAINTGDTVNFTDTSTGTPTSWSWSFTGGTPSTSTSQNPSVTYNTAGTYAVSLTATNAGGSDTETKTGYITVTDTTITYCSSQGNNYSYEYIGTVTIGSFTNTSSGSSYSDFTNQTINVSAGYNYNVSLTPVFPSSTYTEYWKIWIDYNHDGDFNDAGEEVFSGSGSSVVTGNFTVQSGTAGTTTRMRISMKWNAAPTSCETFSYGEVEDYTVNIQ